MSIITSAHLCKYVIELHGDFFKHTGLGRQAFAIGSNAASLEDGMAIQYWAEQLLPQVGALERDTVAANFLDRLMRGAVDMGASRPRLLAAVNLTDAAMRNPIGRFARPVLSNLFAAIELEFKDPAAAMHMAGSAQPKSFSDVGYIALFSANVGQILGDTVDIQAFRHNLWRVQLDTASNPARLSWTLPDMVGDQLDRSIEFTVASYAHLYHNAIPANLSPRAVRFRHSARFDKDVYERILGCPVYFNAVETSMEFDRAQLALPSPNANPELQRRLMANYDQPMQWLAQGKLHTAYSFLYLASELNKSPLKLDRVAASFGMTERTLRRKLVAEGYSFRDLLEKVRRDLCDLYRFENRRSISTIAELLGYAELSAFTRAHKRWYGQPPSLRKPERAIVAN
jgi:AraC-like DNA-binding protein